MEPDTSPRRSRIEFWAISLATACFIWLAGALVPALRLAENWVSDLARVALAPSPPLSADIALVTITEETLAELPYRSPINRHLLAEAVDKIARSGAKGLALDILLDQPTEPKADERLYQSLHLAAARLPVVVAFAGEGDNLTASQAKFLGLFTEGLDLGLVNLPADPDDGAVRWILLGKELAGKGTLPGLALALAQRAAPAGHFSRTGTQPLALAAGSQMGFPAYPLNAVPLLPSSWLAGKFIFVGGDLPHADRHRTSVSAFSGSGTGMMPGVMIHAHAFNQLINDVRLREAPPWALVPIGFLLALLATTALGVNARMGFRLLLGATLLFGYGGLTIIAVRLGVLLPIVMPSLAVLIACGIKGGLEWRREQKQSSFIQEAFARYLSPSVVKLLVQDPSRLKLGGEQREITYVFTDIAGFTTISEQLTPTLMAEILNGYLDQMCLIALEHEATIDKIVGDAVVAFFNAPLDQPDHAERAVRLTLAYDAFSERFRAEWLKKDVKIGMTRIGVNTGRATVGNFGGQRFFNYTGHGDSVNTAARLETVNKHLGTRICISGVTAKRCPEVSFRPIGTLVLKGKSQGIEVFEPLTGQKAYAPLEAYESAFRQMSERSPAAHAAFAQLAANYPEDPLVALHAGRLAGGELGTLIVMHEK